jgi:sec-independent protein translocase protein TatA
MLPGHWEWVIIALVILLLFGAKKIPELAKGLGSGIKEFKKATKDGAQEADKQIEGKEEKKSEK